MHPYLTTMNQFNEIPEAHTLRRPVAPLGCFGPSLYYIPGIMFYCPLSWIALFVQLFRSWPTFRLHVWQLAYLDPARHGVVAFYYWLKAFPVPLSAVLLGLALLYGIIRYASSSYTLNTDGDLIINTGLLGIGTRMGPFIEFQLTIPAAVIGEVDISRNPIQFLFRTGTLSVTYRELDVDHRGHKGSEVIILPFILKPEKARDALMASSQVHNARFIV